MSENLDSEQRNRLWEHGMHAENVFFNQLNFFLVFESILLGVVGILYNNRSSGKLFLLVTIVFGFLLTIFWLYVQTNRAHVFHLIKDRLRKELPEYQETLRQREQGLPKWRDSNLTRMAYIIPSLIAAMWFVLLIYILLFIR